MQHQADARQGGKAIYGAPPIGRLCDVEGRHLFLHQTGSGGPAVVFAPGGGCIGLDYLIIHDQVSQFTTSVLYDRAGTGWSDNVELPRNSTEVAAELRSLLRAAGVPAPYLLVGHSLGGIYARRYAQCFPDEVAGLLLLDPAHEHYLAHMPKQTLIEKVQQSFALLRIVLQFKRIYRGIFERMLAKWPDSMRQLLVDYHLRFWRIGVREVMNLEGELYDEVRRGGDMPDVPLIVLTAMGIDVFRATFAPDRYQRELNDGKRIINTTIAASVPRGEHRLLENAWHSTIHTDRPDAVVQAIRDLLDKIGR
jgi:pimeloyl-ACP methyl ester carboxylesterase